MKVKSRKTFKCDRCSKVYKFVGFLRRHQQYYCVPSTDDHHYARPEPPAADQYYCLFCETKYLTARLFNLHYLKCKKKFEAAKVTKQSTPSSKSSKGVRLHVCSICNKGFSRFGTYQCHLSVHKEKKTRTVKSVIVACNSSKELPDTSKLPRIPRLSARNELHPDHSFSLPPEAEPLPEEVVKDLEEPVLKLSVTLNGDEVVITREEMPKLLIQDVRHVERVETPGLSMPELEPFEGFEHEPNPNEENVTEELLEEMRISDEDEEPSQATRVPSQEVPSSEDVLIIDEPDSFNAGEQTEGETVPAMVSSGLTETVVVSDEEDDLVIVEDGSTQPNRMQVMRTTTTSVATINVRLTSTINLLDTKPFKCTRCNRGFHTENTLQLHYSSHMSKRSDHFKRVHSCSHKRGEPRCCSQKRPVPERCPLPRLFRCSFCEFSSVTRKALKKHRFYFHRKNFACKLCKRTFRTRHTRSMHLKMHTGGGESSL